jgi:DNA-binding transcriptional LysR family regulator
MRCADSTEENLPADVSMMLQFVANDLGVAIVPSELARSSARTSRLHFLFITASGVRLPKWRLVVVVTVPRRETAGKTIVDRFLEVLSAHPAPTSSPKDNQQPNV